MSKEKKCPSCGSNDVHRIKRKFWMRFIWGSARYYCASCNKSFLLLGTVQKNKSPNKKYKENLQFNLLLTIVASILIALLVVRSCISESGSGCSGGGESSTSIE